MGLLPGDVACVASSAEILAQPPAGKKTQRRPIPARGAGGFETRAYETNNAHNSSA